MLQHHRCDHQHLGCLWPLCGERCGHFYPILLYLLTFLGGQIFGYAVIVLLTLFYIGIGFVVVIVIAVVIVVGRVSDIADAVVIPCCVRSSLVHRPCSIQQIPHLARGGLIGKNFSFEICKKGKNIIDVVCINHLSNGYLLHHGCFYILRCLRCVVMRRHQRLWHLHRSLLLVLIKLKNSLLVPSVAQALVMLQILVVE